MAVSYLRDAWGSEQSELSDSDGAEQWASVGQRQ